MKTKSSKSCKLVYLLIILAGFLLMLAGAWWCIEYAVGEWTANMGRWEYFKNNIWLSIKGAAAVIIGLITINSCIIYQLKKINNHYVN